MPWVPDATMSARIAEGAARQSRGRVCAGARVRQPLAARRVPCGARSRGPSRNSLRSLRSLRSNNLDESEDEARAARARPRALRSSAPHNVAAVAHPPTALPAPPWHASSNSTSVAARWAVPGVGDLWGGEQASPDTNSPVDCLCLASSRATRPDAACKARAEGGARSALRSSDSPRLFERSDRRERSEFRGAPSDRAAQRSRPAGPTATVGAHTGYRPPRRARSLSTFRASTRRAKRDAGPGA